MEGILNWTITPSISLIIMAVQINTHTNIKREKIFWILQALFYLGLIINLISVILISVISVFTTFSAIIGSLSILLIFIAVMKTGKIEKEENRKL